MNNCTCEDGCSYALVSRCMYGDRLLTSIQAWSGLDSADPGRNGPRNIEGEMAKSPFSSSLSSRMVAKPFSRHYASSRQSLPRLQILDQHLPSMHEFLNTILSDIIPLARCVAASRFDYTAVLAYLTSICRCRSPPAGSGQSKKGGRESGSLRYLGKNPYIECLRALAWPGQVSWQDSSGCLAMQKRFQAELERGP
jgi:hypothetical protein